MQNKHVRKPKKIYTLMSCCQMLICLMSNIFACLVKLKQQTGDIEDFQLCAH